MQELLEEDPRRPVRVLVVWQSILATDWASPGTNALGRVRDTRARQFWDKDNLFPSKLGQRIQRDRDHPQPDCCWDDGVPWDMVAVYRPGAKWDDDLPAAVYADGPVYRLKTQVAEAWKAALEPQP